MSSGNFAHIRERPNVYLLELNCGTYIESEDAEEGSVTSDVLNPQTIAPEMSSDEELPSKQSIKDFGPKQYLSQAALHQHELHMASLLEAPEDFAPRPSLVPHLFFQRRLRMRSNKTRKTTLLKRFILSRLKNIVTCTCLYRIGCCYV